MCAESEASEPRTDAAFSMEPRGGSRWKPGACFAILCLPTVADYASQRIVYPTPVGPPSHQPAGTP